MLAKASDFVYYTNVIGSEVNSISLDKLVLPVLKNVLKEEVPKKVIFIHLMGTHTRYSNRYPKEFEIFKDKPQTKFPSETSYRVINEYDNAVLYNDYIINNIISNLKKSHKENEIQQLLYFSDHGEELFRTMDFYGHSNEIGSYPMYEIPFLYWSNSSINLSKYRSYIERKYMTDDLIYSVADILDIEFDGMNYERSLFNDAFIPKNRIVNRVVNFDKEFKK
jgi:heptose-I-phosphate ethanolaminephosphotransferase